METEIKKYISELEEVFYRNKSAKANEMARYMKDKFVYFGIASPVRKEIQKEFLANLKPILSKGNSAIKWEIIEVLWEKEQREFQYVAIDWIKSWSKSHWEESDIQHLECLIIQKSWWDSVDLLASNSLGIYFKKFPNKIPEIIENWRCSNNFWLQRSCLLFQLKYKNTTDFSMLKSLISQFQGEKEFFIQKAIGWSLRAYGDHNAKAVLEFVEEINLQGLAKREAIRKIV